MDSIDDSLESNSMGFKTSIIPPKQNLAVRTQLCKTTLCKLDSGVLAIQKRNKIVNMLFNPKVEVHRKTCTEWSSSWRVRQY